MISIGYDICTYIYNRRGWIYNTRYYRETESSMSRGLLQALSSSSKYQNSGVADSHNHQKPNGAEVNGMECDQVSSFAKPMLRMSFGEACYFPHKNVARHCDVCSDR